MPNRHPSRFWRGYAMRKPHKLRGAGGGAKDPVATRVSDANAGTRAVPSAAKAACSLGPAQGPRPSNSSH